MRQIVLLLALLGLFVVTDITITSEVYAQTQGMDRRGERRDNRQDSREDKRECKAGDEASRSECRQEKRESKREGRGPEDKDESGDGGDQD